MGAVLSAAMNLADRSHRTCTQHGLAVLGASSTALVTVPATDAWTAAPLRLLTGVAMPGLPRRAEGRRHPGFPAARGLALKVVIGALAVGSRCHS